ncbi:MAG: segregation/condensation protein A [Polaromonas sp.]|nr:segregation/condensation protein A [Polaromonas sp.]
MPAAIAPALPPAGPSGQPAATLDLPGPADPAPLARLYGEPMFAIPQDLYIPPDALQVFLDAFEGPLDLLLYLIRRQNFNILDIPMAVLTRQYLVYVDEIRTTNLELAAEYLLMAAMLIEIKSRLLLPPRKAAADQEAGDPRAELVRRLLDYEQIKLAAQRLGAMPREGRDFLVAQAPVAHDAAPRLPEVTLGELQDAWQAVARRARLVQHHVIRREELSVREHMASVLRRLQGRSFLAFDELFDTAGGMPLLVVTFIALLELAKECLLEITQAESFAPIYIRLAYTPA